MLPNATQLAAAIGCPQRTALTWLPLFHEACALYEITALPRLSAFLAQVGHESAGLSRTVENLNYSADGLRATWPKRFDAETARQYARQPERIANLVYANRMGNGDVASGDGWRYRGRGALQVTGKANYAAVVELLLERKAHVPDFVDDPAALAEPRWAAFSAAALWRDRGLNDLADSGDFRGITVRINGGMNGWEDRRARLFQARKALTA